jgi:hypothetical protein
MMTMVLARLDMLDDVQTRLTMMEVRLAPPPPPQPSMPYGMPGYGSTLLTGSPSTPPATSMVPTAPNLLITSIQFPRWNYKNVIPLVS